MDVDSNESLIFCSLYRFQVSCGLVDEKVEKIQEAVVHVSHYSFVCSGLGECHFRVSGPNHLQSQDPNLPSQEGNMKNSKCNYSKVKLFTPMYNTSNNQMVVLNC